MRRNSTPKPSPSSLPNKTLSKTRSETPNLATHASSQSTSTFSISSALQEHKESSEESPGVLSSENILESAFISTPFLPSTPHSHPQTLLLEEAARKIAELEIRTTKAEAAANHIAHEIRGYLQNLQAGFTSIDEAVSSLNQQPATEAPCKNIKNTLRGLAPATDEILEVCTTQLDNSKRMATKVVLEENVMVLHNFLKDTMDIFSARALRQKINLVLNVEKTLWVKADRQSLKRILNNLISNAIKFTPEDGSVTLTATAKTTPPNTQDLTIWIEDSGIGMSREQINNLFKNFVQVHNNHEKDYSGSGIGLAIAKNSLDDLNGKVDIESTPGKGSKFILNFKFPEPTKEEKATYHQKLHHAHLAINPELSMRKMHILIAEDNTINCKILTKMLESFGHTVESAANGKEALEKHYSGTLFDIIFMDIEMPIISGLEVTRAIRSDKTNINSCIIIGLSGNGLPADHLMALESGMNDFLTKPIQKAVIGLKLKEWVVKIHYNSFPEKARKAPPPFPNTFLSSPRSAIIPENQEGTSPTLANNKGCCSIQ